MRKPGTVLRSVLLLLAAGTLFPATCLGLWPYDGKLICNAIGWQGVPAIVPDDSGGVVVVWMDARIASYGIYAQRVSAAGDVQWVVDGVALATGTGEEAFPEITPDGAGGAIAAWEDTRSGNSDIYVQRVNASGDVQWAPGGLALCTTIANQEVPAITSDGASGAIVAWEDERGGWLNFQIYAQRVDSSGNVGWTRDGVAVCTAANSQYQCRVVSDGVGGAIVAWADARSGTSNDIYAQRLGDSGVVKWAVNGVALCATTGDQLNPAVASDGAGGAIVVWRDHRSGTSYDIYAQRVNALGDVQWPQNGVALCTAASEQGPPDITSDGAGGAIVTWQDDRAGNFDIYAQRVDASGAVVWATDGIEVCGADGTQRYLATVSDRAGGVIVSWEDLRGGILESYTDIYAQRVDASGAVQWTPDGAALCTAAEAQYSPAVASDGAGGAIVTWYDYRGVNSNIYAQRVDGEGHLISVGQGEVAFPPSLLEQNSPNPFNPVTVIRLVVATAGTVRLVVYDLGGRPVRVLLEGFKQAGRYEATWDGLDEGGHAVASGVYLCVLEAPGYGETRKMVLLR